ncbi:MAG: thiamine ABC transporter substrate-binding protein [Acidimicrobiia bacterium]
MKYKLLLLALIIVLSASACTSTNKNSKSNKKDLVLITYDSFPKSGTSLNKALKDFTKESGIKVKIANAGDTGTMLSKAALTSGNPEGDVMWGIDNTYISKARNKKIFIDSSITSVDYGDVCINYDKKFFKENNLEIPKNFDDLIKPEYKGMLVAENPASSSPGLAFLLGTISKYGESKWKNYWTSLKANEVKIVESWDSAYYEAFSGSSGKGKYPLVVSYATSPAAEVVYSEEKINESPTGNIDGTCFRQEEYAGILRGTKNTAEAKKLLDFLTSPEFQKEIPLNLFVYPSNKKVTLPVEFTKYASKITKPLSVNPKIIEKNRQTWIDDWTNIVMEQQ